MLRQCDICGKEENERMMKSINIGRKTEWWCWDCYKQSQYEASASDKYRQGKLYKIHKAHKRNK